MAGPAIVHDAARRHILDGDARGGGHRFGTGAPGKSEFPADWSDEKIIAAIEAVANDASSRKYRRSRDSRVIVEGVRDGIVLRVVIEADGIQIITAHPIDVPRNQ